MIEIKKDIIDKIKEKLPELPHQKFERYKKEFKISSELAYSITSDLELAQFYERLVKKIEPDFAASWMNILKKTLYYNDTSLKETKLTEELFLRLLELIKSESVTDRGGELRLREIIFKPENFIDLAKKFSKIETNDIEEIIDNTLKKYNKAVRDYKKGDKKALNFLIGMVTKETEKRIDAKTIQHLLEKKLE
jgi:aspartyl-tRNA(Asn)/glutamyl-tRNA(Gln) amidotransferase subunit B